MNLTPIEHDGFIVRGDTLCSRKGDGYERTLVVAGWDPDDTRRIARVHIRVDRFPANSYAHIDVWVPATGWNYITSIPHEEWWTTMPGFERSGTETAHIRSMRLVELLVRRLTETRVP